MIVDQESLGHADPRGRATAQVSALHPLKQASQRIAEFREGRSLLKAKDLVGLLLSHGARAWRASQPVSDTRLRVEGTSGRVAVRMRFR